MSASDSGHAKLAAWMQRHKITQAEVARTFAVTPVTAHYWATGARVPSHQRALALEAWTDGAVPAASWLSDEQLAASEALDAILPRPISA